MHKSTLTKFASLSLLVLTISLLNHAAFARDISSEQKHARDARKTYHQKNSSYNNLSTQVTAQEKRVADEQARLAGLKSNHSRAKAELENAKTDLDAKVKTLNHVWDERNR